LTYRIRWLRGALRDLNAHAAWLKQFPQAKPTETINLIRATAIRLALLGDVGRPDGGGGRRTILVSGRPYRLVYRVAGDAIEIIAVFHTAQDR
jgi:toxin ParE1/3/4